MPFLKPDDSVPKTISLERWQRRWLQEHPNIKFSTMIQLELLNPLIEKKDPEYYKKYGPKKTEINIFDDDTTELGIKVN